MLNSNQLSIAGLCLTGVPVLGGFFAWLNAKRKDHETRLVVEARRELQRTIAERQNTKFVRSMATNHLPHLYNADKKLAEGMNLLLEKNGLDHRIEIDDAPPINFVPFDPEKEEQA